MRDTPSAGPLHLPLLEDGALVLQADTALAPLMTTWLPNLPWPPAPEHPESLIDVSLGGMRTAVPDGAPTLRLGPAEFRHDAQAQAYHCHGTRGGCSGTIDLRGGRAVLVAPDTTAECGADLYSMLTVSAALLLGRLGRSLVHAAAVVSPSGGTWVLPGDTHAGKTTACANLLDAGWRYISDDHIILSPGQDGGVRVEGWPRTFHLDTGWEKGAIERRRDDVDPSERWPGRWQRSGTLSGVLLPSVQADSPTIATPAPAADALAALIRQSPWLLADPQAAPALVTILTSAASPAFRLRAGLDSYTNPLRLVDALRAAGIA